eukprot:12663894-Alexandrium_andersonii.AAC.1
MHATSTPDLDNHTKRALGISGEVLAAMSALSANNDADWAPRELQGMSLSPYWPPHRLHELSTMV